MLIRVNSCTLSLSSSKSSSVGGSKPAGCFVDRLRTKPGANAGRTALRRSERADVRKRDGRVIEAIVLYCYSWLESVQWEERIS